MDENRVPDRNRKQPVNIIYGYSEEITHWVERELCETYTDCQSIGFSKDGKIIGGVVFHNYRAPSIELSIATIDPSWATRKTLKHIFTYPFIELGVKRCTAITDVRNQSVRTFLERMGWVHEASLKDALHDGDAAVYRMLKSECRWLERNKNGQRFK